MKSPLPPPISQTTGEPSWRWRRIVILTTVAFCMMMIAWMVDRDDTQLNMVIASGLLWLAGVLILGYAGLATVQDVSAIITTRTGRPYADPAPPPTPVDHPPAEPVIVVQKGGVVQADPNAALKGIVE